ncbi:hypothetical protein M8Z33_04910 [Streptomyces sp. ZAF1911]|uniref:hypothetical protein n=1 Tax=Streptomyces sp. ZAF1911 TaxID=2944129 RepID=UPI00237B5FF5|nr:hypothetical protein [Streptomyces sp. ZAF1911]MDD9376020.1 hypothetical protein [Streptomyces sp. ZAF1911]
MTSETVTSAATATAPAANRPRMQQHVTTAGSALAVALVPLVVGVLVAKGLAADPHAPVNALITGGGQRAGLPRAEWRRRGAATMRRLRTVRRGAVRGAVRGRAYVGGSRPAGR